MDSSEAFIRAFVTVTDLAVDHSMSLRIVTKAHDVFYGVPTTTGVDVTGRPSKATPAEKLDLSGPIEHTVTIEGREVLAQEVAQFTLMLR